MKRDDFTGFASGGNKARKLEFLIANAREMSADTLITAGGLQSNHARQTAAAGAREGFRVILALADLVPDMSSAYRQNGNLLLDRIFGAEVRSLTRDANMNEAMQIIAEEVRASGGRPYVIPIGGSSGHGVLGHVEAGLELRAQADALGVKFRRVVVASGSGGTQAGLLLASIETGIPVTGFCVGASAVQQRAKIEDILRATTDLLGVDLDGLLGGIEVDDGFVGDGYGRPTAAMFEAVSMAATSEGIILDPVYTGKAMAGLIGGVRSGKYSKSERIVFLHTGGSPGLYAYEAAFNALLQTN